MNGRMGTRTVRLMVTQVDYLLSTGCQKFSPRSLRLEALFDSKPVEPPPLPFTGLRISHSSKGSYVRHQPTKTLPLRFLQPDAYD